MVPLPVLSIDPGWDLAPCRAQPILSIVIRRENPSDGSRIFSGRAVPRTQMPRRPRLFPTGRGFFPVVGCLEAVPGGDPRAAGHAASTR